MDTRVRIGLVALVALGVGGCAIGTRLGWYAERVTPSDAIRANCELNVKTLQGRPDHDTAMRACVDAKSRQAATPP